MRQAPALWFVKLRMNKPVSSHRHASKKKHQDDESNEESAPALAEQSKNMAGSEVAPAHGRLLWLPFRSNVGRFAHQPSIKGSLQYGLEQILKTSAASSLVGFQLPDSGPPVLGKLLLRAISLCGIRCDRSSK